VIYWIYKETDMKNILCYGDSNTYGYNPENGKRYPENIRWTGRLLSLLGSDYRVIEEGCNGRTTVFTDPIESWKRGIDYLRPCLNSHKPIDLVILMLGSNDLKEMYHATAEEIADGAGQLVEVIKTFTEEKQGFVPKILLMAPPKIGAGINNSPFNAQFNETAIERSSRFPELYKKVADEKNCIFINTADYIKSSEKDSLHLDVDAHARLAEEIFKAIKKEEMKL
jgi:lysophospholipase L1-like esterase